MILIAHFVLFLLSYASTTLPKVPWPRSLLTWSVDIQYLPQIMTACSPDALTSFTYGHILRHYVMTIIIIDLLMSRHGLGKR